MATDLASEGQKQIDAQQAYGVKGQGQGANINPDDFYTQGGSGILGLDNTEHVNVVKNINPNLTSAVQGQTDLAGMTQDQIAARSMNGVAERGQASLANPDVMAEQSHALGGDGDPGMQAAIANRQNKMYSSDINNMSRIAKINAAGTQMEQQSAGMQAEAALEQQKQQLINTAMVKYQDDQARRNQILTSVLQIGGAVAGAAIGGSTGAKAGSGIGSAAGSAMGNAQNNGGNFQ